jgi:hypothetical protein
MSKWIPEYTRGEVFTWDQVHWIFTGLWNRRQNPGFVQVGKTKMGLPNKDHALTENQQ